eukprot:TRINITY_DN1529_c0_g1_i1.p1 TRINITY_DN1529_c0_g1~~TRINITY_DN1529_c0_g1_i1.p1  ORF type:complete len:137 (-),score=45.78 TRINITY_DN1529_c0_g1_i1:137-547(-)
MYERESNLFKLPTAPPKVDHEKFASKMKKEDLERFNIKNTVLTDITCLLVLPQKLAAAKLDLSESMLCKKFKEVTDKKWPYRQLKKIEREINTTKSKEELEKLVLKRNDLLTPLSIYVRRFITQQEADDENFTFDK